MSNVAVASGSAARLSTRLSFLVAGLVTASWAPQVPYAKARLGLGDSAFGLLLLCLGVGSVLAMQFTGTLVARIGSRPIVLISGAGLCLTLPGLAWADSTFALATCLLLFGATLGSLDVALTGDFVVKHLGQRKTLLWGGLAVAAGFALLLLPWVWIASGGFLLIGLGAANLVPILFSSAGRQNAMSPALAVASITTLGYAGVLAGPAAIGFMASLTSLRAAFAVLGLVMLGFPLLRGRIPTG